MWNMQEYSNKLANLLPQRELTLRGLREVSREDLATVKVYGLLCLASVVKLRLLEDSSSSRLVDSRLSVSRRAHKATPVLIEGHRYYHVCELRLPQTVTCMHKQQSDT